MRLAAKKDGKNLRIISGFRTMKEQKKLYARWKAGRGNLAAKPGRSNHQNGIALDLNPKEGGNKKWLQKNAGKFDFCRTVPSEDWHYEYLPNPKSKKRCVYP
jgi:LAS superfamily LD-carboxypeptidase LdcB